MAELTLPKKKLFSVGSTCISGDGEVWYRLMLKDLIECSICGKKIRWPYVHKNPCCDLLVYQCDEHFE